MWVFQTLTDDETDSTSASLLDLVRTPNMRKHTFILMFNWSVDLMINLMEQRTEAVCDSDLCSAGSPVLWCIRASSCGWGSPEETST